MKLQNTLIAAIGAEQNVARNRTANACLIKLEIVRASLCMSGTNNLAA